jgi:RNase H-fold protein (predicted Holliday junction resolvase)
VKEISKLGFYTKLEKSDPMKVEVNAIIQGIKFVVESSDWNELWAFTDCSNVHSLVVGGKKNSECRARKSRLRDRIQEIQRLMKKFGICKLEYLPLRYSSANALAKWGHTQSGRIGKIVTLESPPEEIITLLEDEAKKHPVKQEED